MIDGAAIRNLGYTIWVAKYSTKSPNIGKYDAWQYTDKGRVAGISGTVDINHFYKEFVLNDYREAVQKRFGFKDSTMDYLEKYVYADDLLKKLATAK
jgi:GH25 family lysozyme M1 (1,4-beta-N-acetylmuramidase)